MVNPFTWRDGVNITGTSVWCDASRAKDLCFLSGGRLDVRGHHRQLLCTQRTLEFLAAAGGRPPEEALLTPFGRPFSLGPVRLELFPSGFLPGAASLLLSLSRDRHVVYAGAVNPHAGPTCEPMQVRAAEALACDAPLAALGRALPSHEEAAAAVRRLYEEASGAGCAAVFVAAPLGSAQEITRLLSLRGVLCHLHPGVLRYQRACEAMGITSGWGNPALAAGRSRRPARRPAGPGEAIVWPLARRLPPLDRLAEGGRARVFLCSGIALSPEAVAHCQEQLGLPGGFAGLVPFPDGIDLPGLLRYVADTGARDLYLTAGYGEKVARALADRHVRVQPLGPPRQLSLFAG